MTMDVQAVLDRLKALYPEARAELNFSNPFEVLIATILSAQCTDKRVNIVTETLFVRYPDPASLARLTPEELEPLIKTCGLHRTKARNIIATCKALLERFEGKVPHTRAELMSLPGVFRVANRIGLVNEPTPEKTEAALRQLLPKGERAHAHHLFIWHGRRCCNARKPDCPNCPLKNGLCRWAMAGEGESPGKE
jgi:endonuclease-3